ncbi:MAG: hypothetical protein HY472_00190 [Candidatus Sungbacteria bacterium]|nr:hypothetical protein [Candidatus Sungbacteria bacterium]
MKNFFSLLLLPIAFAFDWGLVNPFGFGMPFSLSAAAAVLLLSSVGFAERIALAGAAAGAFEIVSALRPGVYALIVLAWVVIEEISSRILSVKGFLRIRGLGFATRMIGFALLALGVNAIVSFAG